MQEKLSEQRLEQIKKKMSASDDIVYLAGIDLFRESAVKDIKHLVQEVENCWKEIEGLSESLKILTDKVSGTAGRG
jgi:tRNA (Thr-GGU) A37 N-methylase